MPLAKALIQSKKEQINISTTFEPMVVAPKKVLPFEDGFRKEVRNIIPHTQQFIIESAKATLDYPSVIVDYAMELCEMHSVTKEFLQYVRYLLTQREEIKQFEYSFAGRNDADIDRVVAFLRGLTGAFRKVNYDRASKVVSGEIIQTARVRCFLSGKYLEIAVSQKVREMVKKLADIEGFSYAVYDNAKVSTLDGRKRNEFDIIVNIDTSWFVLEIKSGENEPDWKKYYDIGKRYNFVPDHFMLVSSCIDEKAAETAEWFNEYYVTNLDRLEEKFVAMIKRNLK